MDEAEAATVAHLAHICIHLERIATTLERLLKISEMSL